MVTYLTSDFIITSYLCVWLKPLWSVLIHSFINSQIKRTVLKGKPCIIQSGRWNYHIDSSLDKLDPQFDNINN